MFCGRHRAAEGGETQPDDPGQAGRDQREGGDDTGQLRGSRGRGDGRGPVREGHAGADGGGHGRRQETQGQPSQ